MNYFDTSALIKIFVSERGSALAESLKQAGPVATATIAYAEVFSGLTRKLREKQLARQPYGNACRQFERDWASYVRVTLRDDILSLTRDLIQRHPLRGFDAIHLASAVNLQNGLSEPINFVAADARLLSAARVEKLVAINVETAAQI